MLEKIGKYFLRLNFIETFQPLTRNTTFHFDESNKLIMRT